MKCAYCGKEINEKMGYIKDGNGNYYHVLCWAKKTGQIKEDESLG